MLSCFAWVAAVRSSQHSSHTPKLPRRSSRPVQALHSGFWQQNVWISHFAFLRSPFPQFTLVQHLATVPAYGHIAQSHGGGGNAAIKTLVTCSCGDHDGRGWWGKEAAFRVMATTTQDLFFSEETRKAATASAFFSPFFLVCGGWGGWGGFFWQTKTQSDGDWKLVAPSDIKEGKMEKKENRDFFFSPWGILEHLQHLLPHVHRLFRDSLHLITRYQGTSTLSLEPCHCLEQSYLHNKSQICARYIKIRYEAL